MTEHPAPRAIALDGPEDEALEHVTVSLGSLRALLTEDPDLTDAGVIAVLRHEDLAPAPFVPRGAAPYLALEIRDLCRGYGVEPDPVTLIRALGDLMDTATPTVGA